MPPIVHSRPFSGQTDVAAITRFLLDTYLLNGTLLNWEPRRWQGRVYHGNDADQAAYYARLPNLVRIWHDGAGQIIGVVIPEYDGGVYLQIHPDHREIEAEMLDWAQANLAQTDEHGQHWLEVWAYDIDAFRSALLAERGYVRSDDHELLRRRPMSLPIHNAHAPEGYIVRTMRRHPDDWQGQADLLNAAFKRTIHNAEEYRNFQSAPIYQLDLDIVVEAPDGTLAANAGFTAHERESFAILEPCCTHPSHQGLGLARAAITDGLRRVHAMGIETAYVGAWYSNAAANHTYARLGFGDPISNYLWRLVW